MTVNQNITNTERSSLAQQIKTWGLELGFDEVGISNTELSEHEAHLDRWLAAGHHGAMNYMAKHGTKRSRPQELIEGTISVISVRIDYAPDNIDTSESVLNQKDTAYISRYALGRDYHKVLRKKLQKLAQRISQQAGSFGYRVFTDSAPVLEKALAEKAGLGWIGKHSNLINSKTGSWFFIGEIYTDLPLNTDSTASNHCGSCQRCIDLCPTKAIIAPYQVDARRCISYLTIELRDSIPVEFREPMGNRIYGCDDCQLVCPWNKFAQLSREDDFKPRADLTDRTLLELFSWDEQTFLSKTEGSAIRRIGHECWQRNISIALGNSDYNQKTINALRARRITASKMLSEHIDWAIEQQMKKQGLTDNSQTY